MPTSYTLKRRIGAMKTNGSSQWTTFTQVDDKFIWATSVVDVNNVTPSITAVSVTMTVPTGIVVGALFRGSLSGSGASMIAFTSLSETDQAPGAAFTSLGFSTTNAGGHYDILTNTSAQIRYRASVANGFFSVITYGWTDSRGKLS
jgi:hypothetical protein